MQKQKYKDYLTSTEWLLKKVELVKQYEKEGIPLQCYVCGFTDNLQAHHVLYENPNRPEIIRFFCKNCHHDYHHLPGFKKAVILDLIKNLNEHLAPNKLFRNQKEATRFIEKKAAKNG